MTEDLQVEEWIHFSTSSLENGWKMRFAIQSTMTVYDKTKNRQDRSVLILCLDYVEMALCSNLRTIFE